MDDNMLFGGSERVRNNPPPTLPDVSGARDPYATSWYGGQLSDLDPGSNQDIGLEILYAGHDPGFDTELDLELDTGPNPEPTYGLVPVTGRIDQHLTVPIGTRSFEQHSSLSTIDFGYSPQYLSTWQDLTSDSLLLDWNSMGHSSGFQSSRSIQRSLQVAPSMVPPTVPYIYDDYDMDRRENLVASLFREEDPHHRTADFGDEMEEVGIDEAELVMDNTGQQLEWAANQLNQEHNLRNLVPQNSVNRPPNEMGRSDRKRTSSSYPRQISRSSSGIRSASRSNLKRRSYSIHLTPTYERLSPRNSSILGFHGSQAELGKLHLKRKAADAAKLSLEDVPQKRPPVQDACVRCRTNKRRCIGAGLEDGCRECRRSKTSCLSTKHLLPVWTLPDLYTNMILKTLSPLDAALKPLRIYRASIYVSFGSGKLGVPLSCKVYESGSTLEDPPQSSMIWENIRSAKADKNCIQNERLASCCIPSTCIPSAEVFLEWAVNSVQNLPSGVVKDFYGPLYTFAANYVRVGSRPLYNLVALTVIHTAIYNVCHSKMTIIFDKRQQARISLPLKLRTQICTSLFQLFEVTGAEIHRTMITALHGLSKKKRIVFCVVNWLLMLTYEHCLDQTSKEARFMEFEGSVVKSEFAKRKQCLEGIVKDLQNLHEILFKKMPAVTHPKFAVAWNIDDNDQSLKAALSTLRTAMLKHRIPKRSAQMGLITSLAPQLYHDTAFKYRGYGPLSDTNTVSTSKKLDFDNMSVDTRLSNRDGNQPLSTPQAIQKVIHNLASQDRC